MKKGVFIGLLVFGIDLTPIAGDMAVQEDGRGLTSFSECGQGSGRCNGLANTESSRH